VLQGKADFHLHQEEINAFPLLEILFDGKVMLLSLVIESGMGSPDSAGPLTCP